MSSGVLMIILATAGRSQSIRTYTYDAVENRAAATGLIRFTSASTFGIEPARAVAGERINIFGRNFPAGQNSAVAVSFSGSPATIVSVGERVIAAVVPANVTSGAVTLSISGSNPVTVGTIRVEGVVVTPGEVELDWGEARQFSATVIGAANQAVTWSVTDFKGGAANVGTITPAGLYTPPPLGNPIDFPFVIRARSTELGAVGHAVVRLRPLSGPLPIANRSFVTGTLGTSNDRHAWEFPGRVLNQAYVACVASASMRSLTLRDRCGVAVARTGAGTRLRIVEVTLDENEVYRIEVQGGQSPSGSYQLWLDHHPVLPIGVWMFPFDDVWHDAANWSQGRLPGAEDAVMVPDYPSDVKIRVLQSGLACASIVSDEQLEIASGGVLTVAGEVQVNNSFALTGGTLIGAVLVNGTHGESLFSTAPQSRLDGVTVAGDLYLSGGVPAGGVQAYVHVVNGLTINGTLHMNGYGPTMGFDGTQTVGGTGTIVFEALAGGGGWASFEMVNGGTLTLSPGLTVRGGFVNIPHRRIWGAAMDVVNHATIVADRPGEHLTFRPDGTTSLVNHGVASAVAGGFLDLWSSTWTNRGVVTATDSTLDFRGTWSNQGTIQTAGGETRLGGTFRTGDIGAFNRSGGTVRITGALDNTGSTLSMTDQWILTGGSILGGTVDVAGQFIAGLGRMEDVTVNGDVFMSVQDSQLIVRNGLTMNGTLHMDGYAPTLAFEGATTVGGNCTILMEPNGNFASLESDGAGVTLAPGVTLRGGQAWMPMRRVFGGLELFNQGRVEADAPGRPMNFTLNSGILVNEGVMKVHPNCRMDVRLNNWTNSGTLDLGGVLAFGGTLTNGAGGTVVATGGAVAGGSVVQEGTMAVQGTLASLTNSGLLQIAGHGAPGLLTASGNFTQTATGSLALDLGGTTAVSEHDRLVVSGASSLSGTIAINLIGGFMPSLGQSFSVLGYASNSGAFTGCTGCGLGGGRVLVPSYTATSLELVVQ
jgi:hypothetical protein